MNILIVIMVAVTWIMMALFGDGTLAENGFGNLKYFTVLSNFLAGIASIFWLAEVRKNGKATGRTERFKYIAATAVGLTFTTVMVFLGPLYGYAMMLKGVNLFFHLIIPVTAMAEIVFLSDMPFTRRDNNLTIVPPLIYGIFYVANLMINGVGEWPDTNDWYLFLTWGNTVGALILASILAVTWLIGLLMRKLQRLWQRRNS